MPFAARSPIAPLSDPLAPIAFDAYVRARLPLTRPATLPEIALHLAQTSSSLSRCVATARDDALTPYWAYLWAGGAVLARHLLDRPHAVAGRRVLDLGAGSGVAAIAAALAGAAEVTAADIDPNAARAVALNAIANGVRASVILGDLTVGPPPDVDVVLVGDLFYAPALVTPVRDFLDRCVSAGIQALVGDPWRAPLPRDRLRLIAEYDAPDFGGGAHAVTTAAAVFAYEASS